MAALKRNASSKSSLGDSAVNGLSRSLQDEMDSPEQLDNVTLASEHVSTHSVTVRPRLPLRVKLLYAMPRIAIAATWILVGNKGRYYYIEALKMPADVNGMVTAVCKSADLLIGFTVGFLSDSCSSRWGRRKPFMALGFPFWLVAFVALHSPPADMRGDELVIYYGVFYFLVFSMGASITHIPYDAMGMELTDDYHERSKLFGWKGGATTFGYLVNGLIGVFLGYLFPDDLRRQVVVPSWLWALIGAVAFTLLLAFVKERRLSAKQRETIMSTKLVPSIRLVMKNRAYRSYLLFKVPSSIAGLMAPTLLSLYLHYNAKEENWSAQQSVCILIVVLSALLTVPLLVRMTYSRGKIKVLCGTLFMNAAVYIVATFMPAVPVMYYLISIVVGVSMSSTFVIPDAILADIIDYDELLSGSRREGTFTVIETNLQQWIEIPAATIPLLVLSRVGFLNNGGCVCQCGVPCETTQNPLDGCEAPPGYEGAACTYQPDQVLWTIRVFFVLIPGIFILLAVWAASRFPITASVHQSIQRAIVRRHAGQPTEDPITKESLAPFPERGPRHEHAPEDMGDSKASSVMAELGFWIALTLVLIAFMAAFPFADFVAYGSIVGAAFGVMVAWAALRLHYLKTVVYTDLDADSAASL